MKSFVGEERLVMECLYETHQHLFEAEKSNGNVGLQNLRRELEERFAGFEIRVGADHSTSSAVATDVVVKWVDGPSKREVEGYCDRFSTVTVGDGGAEEKGRATAWMRAFGTVRNVRLERKLTTESMAEFLVAMEEEAEDGGVTESAMTGALMRLGVERAAWSRTGRFLGLKD